MRVRMCVFVFVGVYIFCGLGNGYIGLNCLSNTQKLHVLQHKDLCPAV